MSMLDFLTSGAPLPAGTAPINKTTTTATPGWYTDHVKNILAGQGVISTRPYEPPPMPRVAGFTDTEKAGMAATTAAAGLAAPGLERAGNVAEGMVGKSGLSAAQPYLDAAGKPVYEGISNYMNPYNDAVTNRIAELGGRNLREQLLPGINDQFIRAGQPGSSRNADMFNRALRDTGENILSQQNAALQAGYSGALTTAGNDLTRTATLANTAGNLGTAAVTSGLDTANTIAKIADQTQTSGLAGAAAVTGVGTAERSMDQRNLDVALADWLKEQGYPQEQIDATLKTLGAVGASGAVPKAQTEVGIQPTSYPQEYANSPLRTGLSTVSTGLGIYKDAKDAGLF